EVDGLIDKDVRAQVQRPKGKVMLGTKRLYIRETGEHGEVVKHKCRFVTQGCRQIAGLHYTELSSLAATTASV
ncbi:unnamed protein product, partial [Sphacelaria rigidula]